MTVKCTPQPSGCGVTSHSSMRTSREKIKKCEILSHLSAGLGWIPPLMRFFFFSGDDGDGGISEPRPDPCDVANWCGSHFNFCHGWLFNWTPACPFANDPPQALRSLRIAQGRPEQIVWGLVQIQGNLLHLSELFLLVGRNRAPRLSVCLSRIHLFTCLCFCLYQALWGMFGCDLAPYK